MKKYSASDYLFLLFPYAVYLVVTLVVFWLSKYTLHSDGVSIINVAEKWHAGHFMDAVNSLWPPLVSILIAIVMYMPVDEVIAFKIVQIGLALVSLFLTDLIIKNWIHSKWVRVSVLTAGGLFLTAYALRDATADMMACVAILSYTLMVTRQGFLSKKWDGVIAGVVWALSYLSRSYLIYFVALHLFLVVIYRWWLSKERSEKRIVIRNGLIALLVFFAVSLPWFLALHEKFHIWTTGISGSLNYNKYNADAGQGPLQSMFLGDHLIPPTGPNDQSMMTELFANQPAPWSPFQSRHTFEYQLLKIWKNLKLMFSGIPSVATVGILGGFSPLLAGTLFAFILYIFSRPAWYTETKNVILASIFLTYPLGYMIIEVNDRYFYILGLLGLIFGGYILEKVVPPGKKKLLIVAVVFLALTYVPFTSIKDLIAGYSFYYNRYSDGLFIKAHLPTANKRTATLGNDDAKTFRIAYYAGIRYYWRLDPTVPIDTVVSQLCKYKIDYPIIDNNSQIPSVAARYKYLKQYYSGELQLQKYPELSLLYNAHLPCWTAPKVTAK